MDGKWNWEGTESIKRLKLNKLQDLFREIWIYLQLKAG